MKNSIELRKNIMYRNATIAVFSQVISFIFKFVTRTAFVYYLSDAYLGYNSLFGDIFQLLSLAELGIGESITFFMYKPAAEKNYRKVSSFLNIYRKLYFFVGTFVLIIGTLLVPYINTFITDIADMSNVELIYILYLLNSSLSYFFVYKKSILIIDQKYNVISMVNILTCILQSLVQCVTLMLFRNFFLYLIEQIFFTIIMNVILSKYVDVNYSYIKKYKKERLDKSSKNNIYKKIVAMLYSKFSSVIVTFTDSLIISKYISTLLLGIYSNYLLFINAFSTIITSIFNSIMGSIGNIVASENNKTSYLTLKKIFFVNYYIVAFFSVIFFSLSNSFINIWLGQEYILDKYIVLVISLNLFMKQIRQTFLSYINAYGAFEEIRIKCIFESLINIIASFVLIKYFKLELLGVLIGTTISNLLTNFWYEPYLIIKKKMSINCSEIIELFIKYFILLIVETALIYVVLNKIVILNGYFGFAIKAIICIILFVVINDIAFAKNIEYMSFKQVIIEKVYKVLFL